MKLTKQHWMLIAVGGNAFGLGMVVDRILTRLLTKPKLTEVELEFQKAEQDKEFNWKMDQLNRALKKLPEALQDARNTADQLKDDGEIFLGRFIKQNDEGNNEEVIMRVVEDVEESAVVSVFTDGDDDWDYSVEEEARASNPNVPYTIHRDEFFENLDDHRQSTLTYYRGDHILCDELDSPIYNPEMIVGKLEFGRGSQDPNVVYIRNPKLVADYEVLLDPGHYQVEVLGQVLESELSEEDLKHSVQKFRFE